MCGSLGCFAGRVSQVHELELAEAGATPAPEVASASSQPSAAQAPVPGSTPSKARRCSAEPKYVHVGLLASSLSYPA